MMSSSLCALLFALVVVSAELIPSHVYVSLTGDPAQARVTFTTTTKPEYAEVTYWSEGSSKVTVAVTAADITTFTRPVTSDVNYINSVTLNTLKNGQFYNYQIVGDSKNSSSTSRVFKFKHIPAFGQPVTLGIYGDLGSYGYALMQNSSNGLKQWAASGKFDLIIHNGDLGYNLGSTNGSVGDDFMRNIEPISSLVPYIVTPGNHEFMTDSVDYYRNFWAGQAPLSVNSKSTESTMWFSFDVGTVHVVGISTEVYCEDTDNIAKQWAWLEGDLRAASSRTNKPWIIVLGHRPLYSGQSSFLHARLMRLGLQCTDPTLSKCDPLTPCKGGVNCGYSIQELLLKYKVDMFNAGHEHIYVRNNPIAEDLTFENHTDLSKYINPQTPLYIISGAPGIAHTPSFYPRNVGDSPQVKTSAAASFSSVVVYNSTALRYTQISAENGDLLDDFWVIKNSDKPDFKSIAFTLEVDEQTVCDQ